MSNPVIPAEAVVAATKVLYADKMSNHSGDNAPQILDACEAVVRKILEAAAPHLMRDAFDQGQKSGMRHAARRIAAARLGRPELPGPLSPNPYK